MHDKHINVFVYVLAFFAFVFSDSNPVYAWGLKTHGWIAQEVLNDALDDGKFSLAGRAYAIPGPVLGALSAHPDRFRMGSLGPDVFPDPIVGQTTTHPGVDGGWQADDWLKHLLDRSASAEELAFSYGFIIHAAGDIFAHTYVNAYAGDVFVFTDDEREVELRHFVLEKFIESVTPVPTDLTGRVIDWSNDFKSATSFARDAFIQNSDAARENIRAGTGFHLAAMYQVRRTVSDTEKATQAVISKLTEWGEKYFRLELDFKTGLASAKLSLAAAEAALDAAEDLLKAKDEVVKAQLKALALARDIVKQHPELITGQTKLLVEQTKLAADLAAEAIRVAGEADRIVTGLRNNIRDLQRRIADLACHTLMVPWLVDKCKKLVGDIAKRIADIEKKITFEEERKALAQKVADEAAKLRDQIKSALDKLQQEFDEAAKGLADGTYEAAVQIAEHQAQAQREVVKQAKKAVEEAKKLVEEVDRKLDDISRITNPIREFINQYNPISVVLRKWVSDIDVASEEYIKASHRAGLLMLTSSGNPIHEYTEWYSCYGQVFIAIPKEVGQVGCLARKYLEEINSAIDGIIAQLPEILQWLIDPTRKLRQIAMETVKDALNEAAFRITEFLSDRRTAEFLWMIADPSTATREKLIEVFNRDESRKGLLVFPDVSAMVTTDLSLVSGRFDPEKFSPIRHSVTLAKLALLDANELNKLVRDIAGYEDLRQLFRERGGSFSILLGMVRSLDGNHQWQAYGLPYPRRRGIAHGTPHKLHFGHDGHAIPGKGLPIWTDRFLRERVFNVLFPSQVAGTLSNEPQLKWPHYRFPSCAQNPFPTTQDDAGVIRTSDATCAVVANPNAPLSDFAPTPRENAEQFFRCGKPNAGNRYTIVGPFRNRSTALAVFRVLRQKYPDMHMEVWRPFRQTTYWPIVVAACAPHDVAVMARDIALRRRLDTQITVDRGPMPWVPLRAGRLTAARDYGSAKLCDARNCLKK